MAIITDNFDSDTSSDWKGYNNTTCTINNNKLICTTNGNYIGVLVSPYNLTLDTPLEFTIALERDYGGLKHAGFWLCDDKMKQWARFAFQNNEFNVNLALDQAPTSISRWEFKGRATLEALSSKSRTIKAEFMSETSVVVYVDGNEVWRGDIRFKPKKFAIFCFAAIIHISALKLGSTFYQVSGKSLQDNGKASRLVLIHDWATGDFIRKITPSLDGAWRFMVETNSPLLITHIGEDGFAPQADGGVIPVMVE